MNVLNCFILITIAMTGIDAKANPASNLDGLYVTVYKKTFSKSVELLTISDGNAERVEWDFLTRKVQRIASDLRIEGEDSVWEEYKESSCEAAASPGSSQVHRDLLISNKSLELAHVGNIRYLRISSSDAEKIKTHFMKHNSEEGKKPGCLREETYMHDDYSLQTIKVAVESLTGISLE